MPALAEKGKFSFSKEPPKIPKKRGAKKGSKAVALRPLQRENVDWMQGEWALEHAHNKTVKQFIIKFKGFTVGQYNRIMKWSPMPEWESRRKNVKYHITQKLIETHVGLIAENQDFFLRTAGLGIRKVFEMLETLPISAVPLYTTIVDPHDHTKKKIVRQITMKSSDIANLMSALGSGTTVYRRVMGLEEDSETTLKSVVNELKTIMVTNNVTVNNLNINAEGGEEPKHGGQKKLQEKNYDDLFELIEMKRQLDSDDVYEVSGENGTGGNGIGD